MGKPTDAKSLVTELMTNSTPEERRALLEALISGHVSSIFEELDTSARPKLPPPPAEPFGFRVRVDLLGAKPPVWRRLDLPGDLTLPRVHDAIQAAMGWTNSHLHRFRTGRDHRSPHFVSTFDLEEGEEGVLEDDVRLDQLVRAKGDALWYEYDFGDGWEHVLQVEDVLDARPASARCRGGRMACPPEDCGGVGGYAELATWVRSGYDDAQLPEVFDDADQARDWLPLEWHPDHFAIDEANAALAVALAEPVAVSGELAELVEQLDRRGVRSLREVLGRPASHGPTQLTDDEAAQLTEPYRVLLDLLGDGVALTSAGHLPPKLVEQLAARTGITGWWIGKANREDLTPPVAALRESARTLGLVAVRRGRVSPTAAGARARQEPQALLRHIVGRLPLGTKDFDRHAGWLAVAVVGSGAPAEQWRDQIGDLLGALGWSTSHAPSSPPPAESPTLAVLEQLAGATRAGWRLTGSSLAVAAAARSVIRQRRAERSP